MHVYHTLQGWASSTPYKVSGVARFRGALVHTFIGGPPTETKKIGVCQNEHRPRYRVQKYVTAIHRRKLVKNWGVECRRYSNGGAFDGSSIPGGVSPSPVRVGSGAPENFFDFVLRNVELLCILDSGAGR